MTITRQTERSLRRAAFTLMEMLVVVAIIVALAGLGGYYFIGQLSESKVSNAKVQSRTISTAIESYYVDHGVYPQDLQQLLVKSEIGKGPYLKEQSAIMDPWGNVFQYDQGGQRNTAAGATVIIPDVYAKTPDGREVGNWTEAKKL
ncbi:MAG: type II secretion system protein GspG [Gemmataceae bacterium]|nr:type II secretion system protein GspG [Gemmataceae bacterium]MCI0740169.1 type II secretion system protein GspG [Gemmataceae bacterium]